MNNFYKLTTGHPVKCICIFLLLTIIFSFGTTKLETKNSFDGELPEDDFINIDINRVKEVFEERSLIMIGIESDDLFTTEGLSSIISLTESVKEIPYVFKDEVKSLATVDNLSERDWGLQSNGFLDELPDSALEWKQLKNDINKNDIVNGTLISADGKFATIVAPLDNDFIGGEVYAAAKRIKENYQGKETIHISGAPILVEDVQLGISKDSKKFIGIAIFLVFIGFYICFRSVIGVLFPLIMVVASIIWTMGMMGYLGLNITVVSNVLPVIMIAVASSYGIHFMNTYFKLTKSYDSQKELVTATLDKIGLPILITGITSSLGSLSLLVFNIHSLKEFGFIGAIGFLFATIICLFLMPALCMIFGKLNASYSDNEILKKITLSYSVLVLNHRKKFIIGYLALIPVCIWFAKGIEVGDDYVKFFPKHHDGRIAAENFNHYLGGIRVMDLMVDSKADGGIKDSNFFNQLTTLQQSIEDDKHVGDAISYVDLVSHVNNTMGAKLKSAELNEESIAQYLMLHEMSATPGEVNNFYDETYSKAHMQVFIKSSNPEDHENIQLAIAAKADQLFSGGVSIHFGGDVMHRIALGKYIVSGKIMNILLALFIVLFSTSLIFRSLKKGLFTLTPIVISLIMVFGFMGITGIRLGISTSLLTAMIVGIGIDFSIHYLVSFYRHIGEGLESAVRKTSTGSGQAIAYDAMSNIIGFSVLSISGFLPVQHFGWLLAFSMLLIFVNTLAIFPIMFGLSTMQNDETNELNIEQLKYNIS